jgi:hypothetical protein
MRIMTLVKASTLAITLALGSVPAWAQQQVGVEGATAGLDPIIGTALDSLAAASVTIPNTNSLWNCVATCSAEVAHVAGVSAPGRLVITNNGVEVVGTDRKFELNNNAGIDDPSPKEVSTTGRIVNLPAGLRTIACAAAKITAAGPNFNVNDSSITVVCSDFLL